MRLVYFDAESPGEAITAFRQLPSVVYKDDPVWSPMSETAVDDCLQWADEGAVSCRGIMVQDTDHPTARVMAIADPLVAPEGWVGLFECLNDAPEAGVAVLEAAKVWLEEQGVRRVVGPRVDGLRSGLLVGGKAGPHTIFTPHNPLRYEALFHAAGFATSTRMVSFMFNRNRAPVFRELGSNQFSLRRVEMRRLHDEIARIESFQAALFTGRSGYVRRDVGGSRRMARTLIPHIDPDLIILAVDRSDETIGVVICLPDNWSGTEAPTRARLISIGVAPGWQGKKVAMSMGSLLKDTLLAKGYQTLEASWILQENSRPQILARLLGAKPSREFCLMATDL